MRCGSGFPGGSTQQTLLLTLWLATLALAALELSDFPTQPSRADAHQQSTDQELDDAAGRFRGKGEDGREDDQAARAKEGRAQTYAFGGVTK